MIGTKGQWRVCPLEAKGRSFRFFRDKGSLFIFWAVGCLVGGVWVIMEEIVMLCHTNT